MDTLSKDLLAQLECPVCMDYMLPPIRMCENGHTICNSCREKLAQCPSCRGVFMSGRCIALEKLTDKVSYPCKYRESGCKRKCLPKDIAQHQRECQHQPVQTYKCPYSIASVKCLWKGSINDLKDHIVRAHIGNLRQEINGKHTVELPGLSANTAWYKIVFSLDEMFFRFSKVINKLLYICILYVGPREKANKYRYTVKIETNGIKQSVSACLMTEWYQNDVDEILEKGNCAVFHLGFVKSCLNDEDALIYELEIFKSSV